MREIKLNQRKLAKVTMPAYKRFIYLMISMCLFIFGLYYYEINNMDFYLTNYISDNNHKHIQQNNDDLIKFTLNISKFNYRHRNISNRIKAFKLLRKGIGKIILIHIRKAGGTTIKQWFNKMAYFMNTSYGINDTVKGKDYREAWPNFHLYTGRGTLRSQMLNDKSNDINSIWVIMFRNPIERILSQYEFEMRWLCQQGSYYYQLLKRDNFNKFNYWQSIENTNKSEMEQLAKYNFAGLTLKEWIFRIMILEINNVHVYQNEFEEHEVLKQMYFNNYYLWIFCCDSRFCNIYKDFIKTGKIWQCLVNAMELLLNFDMVLITEWMNDLRSHLFVMKLFWNKIDFEILEHKFSQNKMNLPFPHIVVNRGRNNMVEKTVLDVLYMLNKWDLIFYKFAKHIAYHRMNLNEDELYNKDFSQLLRFNDNSLFQFEMTVKDALEFREFHGRKQVKLLNNIDLLHLSELIYCEIC